MLVNEFMVLSVACLNVCVFVFQTVSVSNQRARKTRGGEGESLAVALLSLPIPQIDSRFLVLSFSCLLTLVAAKLTKQQQKQEEKIQKTK